jgi:hypothetical protein
MEQVLTLPSTAARRSTSLAERLLRCALIEEALAAALAAARARSSDESVPATLREHAAQDERHAERLRELAWEMADPGRNGASRPDADLIQWLGALSRAQGEVETLAGLYGVLKITLADAYRDLIADSSETDRALRSPLSELLREEEDSLEWGWERLRRIAAAPDARIAADDWAEYLRRALRAAGDIWGDMPRAALPERPGFTDP